MVWFRRNRVCCFGALRKVHKETKSYSGTSGQCPYMGHAIVSSVCLLKEHSKGWRALPKDNNKHAQTVTDVVIPLVT
jgi:hypothetical protein